MDKGATSTKNTKSSFSQNRTRKNTLEDPINHRPCEHFDKIIKRRPLLTAEQEVTLSLRIKRGDTEAFDCFVESNLRLVMDIARGYRGSGLDYVDLVQEGIIGLIRAVNGFDPSRNVRFCTYAYDWIKQAIMRGLNDKGKLIRLSAHKVRLLQKISAYNEKFYDIWSREPQNQEISDWLLLQGIRCSPEEIYSLRQTGAAEISLHGAVLGTNQENQILLIDTIEDCTADKYMDIEIIPIKERLSRYLNPKETTVIINRFGLIDDQVRTLEEVGQIIHLSKERVRQIERRALKKLLTQGTGDFPPR